jgi:hypothetical protein
MSGADNDDRPLRDRPLHNRSLRHRDNPIAGAQELPMSSPLTADVGFRLVRAALVSASRTMGTPIRPQRLATRKGGPAPEGRIRPHPAAGSGIVSPRLLLFKCAASVPPGGFFR